ncbi:MAG TPA: energy transducer TonB [Chthoniobacterales bacterium]|jgi:outer membrane biosynthesis protein TonB
MIETVRTERQKQRKRTLVALLLSLLIHLLIVLVAFVLLSLKPEWLPKVSPPPQPQPAEFTLIPAPSPTPPSKNNQRDFVDSSQATVSEQAPDKAAFESDQNTVAASELPAQSNAPVPTLNGEEGPGLTLQSQDLSLGPNRQPVAPSPASPSRPAQAKPAEKSREEKKTEKEPPKEATPTPTPKATPRPKPTPNPEDDALALLKPEAPTPKPPEAKPEVRQPEKPAQPSKPQPPGFQPQRRVTRLTGGISNRGRSSVDAVATPLGRYKKMLSDAIGSRWYYYVNDMLDLVGIGTVELRFVVGADGTVERVQVLRNSSNESLASCSVRAIMEAEIPPIPRDVSELLEGGKLEVDYSFTIQGR